MTEDAPWMGTTPTIPNAPACTGRLSCGADLHTIECARAEAEVHKRDRSKTCSNEGHEWDFLVTANGALTRVGCGRCGKSYEVVET